MEACIAEELYGVSTSVTFLEFGLCKAPLLEILNPASLQKLSALFGKSLSIYYFNL